MGRFAYSFVVLAVSFAVAPTAIAQEPGSGPPCAPPLSCVQAATAVAAQPDGLVTPVQQKRPAAMVPLYGVFAAAQVLDYASTTRAVSNGTGSEGNPVMAPLADNHAAFVAVKAASVAGVVWAGEKLWRKNRIGAIVFMVAMDSAVVTIAAHNYSVARR